MRKDQEMHYFDFVLSCLQFRVFSSTSGGMVELLSVSLIPPVLIFRSPFFPVVRLSRWLKSTRGFTFSPLTRSPLCSNARSPPSSGSVRIPSSVCSGTSNMDEKPFALGWDLAHAFRGFPWAGLGRRVCERQDNNEQDKDTRRHVFSLLQYPNH